MENVQRCLPHPANFPAYRLHFTSCHPELSCARLAGSAVVSALKCCCNNASLRRPPPSPPPPPAAWSGNDSAVPHLPPRSHTLQYCSSASPAGRHCGTRAALQYRRGSSRSSSARVLSHAFYRLCVLIWHTVSCG